MTDYWEAPARELNRQIWLRDRREHGLLGALWRKFVTYKILGFFVWLEFKKMERRSK